MDVSQFEKYLRLAERLRDGDSTDAEIDALWDAVWEAAWLLGVDTEDES